LQLDAEFAGFAQILVYIGAVAILIVFAILLTRSSETPADERGVFSRNWFAGLVVSAAVFAVLSWAVLRASAVLPGESAAPTVTVGQIGEALIGPYVLPLEIVALLLTAALIGAVIVAMHEKGEAK
jgi:NADH-quinone oxidoreductase subunit J